MPLLDLPPNGCKFAIGDAAPDAHLFCGEPRDGDRPYCPAHCRLAYRPAAAPLARVAKGLSGIDNRPSTSAAFRADIIAAVSDSFA